jgi:hypothetical protein
VLALLLTAAKVLFCGGALAAAQQLLSWLEPLEAAVAAARHQSQHGHAAPGVSIRNELAYSQLLRRLLQPCLRPALPAGARRADDASSEATPRALYICGDSHVLPGEWGRVVRACAACWHAWHTAAQAAAVQAPCRAARTTAVLTVLRTTCAAHHPPTAAAAWRAVSVWGEPRLLVPLLVTGCKASVWRAWCWRRAWGAVACCCRPPPRE